MYRVPKFIATALILAPALLLTFPVPSRAQNSPQGEYLRTVTNELAQPSGSTSSSRELRQKRLSQIRERADLLYRLIAENPSQAVPMSLAPEVADRLRTEFPEVSDRLESESSLESRVVVLIEDNPTPRVIRAFVQMQEQLGKPLVYFASKEPAGLKTGDILRIAGLRIGDRIAAVNAQVVQSASAVPAGVTGGELKTPVLEVKFSR